MKRQLPQPEIPLKPVHWIGSSLKDLKEFPRPVWGDVGRALDEVQRGQMPSIAKPLTGFPGASVLEIAVEHQGNAFRAVYTVQFREAAFVLHCFQKKSKRGVQTPLEEMVRIRKRLKRAISEHSEIYGKEQP